MQIFTYGAACLFYRKLVTFWGLVLDITYSVSAVIVNHRTPLYISALTML